MKPFDSPRRPRTTTVAITAWLASVALVPAAPFLYQPTDLVLLFRQPGNASDWVVHLGSVTQFNAIPPGTTVPIGQVSLAQLTAAFPNLNGLLWSAAAANRPPVNPAFPLQTVWVTAPRTDPNTPSKPWLRKGQFVQGNAASQIDGVGVNAALTSSLIPGGPNNTATSVVLPVAANFPIAPLLGSDGNYAGTFQGKVETVTPEDFDSQPSNVSRTDLYELIPGSTAAGTLNQPGRYLGTFELKSDGSLTFVVASAAPPAPRITAISRVGDVSTISFTTAPGFTYRLRRTDAAGIQSPVSNWTSAGSIAGTGSVVSLQDTQAASPGFYAVEVVP